MKKHKVIVNSLKLLGFHGVFEEEKLNGNTFEFNLEVSADLSKGMNSDEIADTINYATMIDVIESENKKASKLLESLASRIVKRLFSDFAEIDSLRLRIDKLNPPLKQELRSVGIEVEESRISSQD